MEAFLKRAGLGLVVAVLGGVVQYLGYFQDVGNLTEFGIFAALVATGAALLIGGLVKVKEKVEASL